MKYSVDMVRRVEQFTLELDDISDADFWKHCSVPHIAKLCGVCKDTVYEWSKTHEEFSVALKRWETARDARFLELKNKNGSWIFLAKNWLEMRDDQHLKIGNADKDGFRVTLDKVITDKRPDEGADDR